MLLLLVACSSGGSSDPGCERWAELLAQQDRDGNVSDEEAARVVRRVEELAEDTDVRAAATALAARLEDGVDISAAFRRMGTVCDL